MKKTSSDAREPREEVDSAVRDFVGRLRRWFARELEADPRGFRENVMRLIRRELPSKRGRPTNPRLDDAARMVQQGKAIRDVLRWLIPGFDEVDDYGKYCVLSATLRN